MPTKSEQSDLFQAVFSAHGDVVRPVLAPTSVADMFATTVEAFNIAEHYQTPVILLSDGEIGQRKEVVDAIDTSRLTIVDRRRPSPRELETYVRYALTESGISPISEPGMAGGNLPRGRDRAQRARRADRQRRHARDDEREAHPQARSADGLARRRHGHRRSGRADRHWWPGEASRAWPATRSAAPNGSVCTRSC